MKELEQAFEETHPDQHVENLAASVMQNVSANPENAVSSREAHLGHHNSPSQTNGDAPHPLSDLFGKYEGDIWNEVFAEIDADRRKDTAASQK